MTRSNLSTPNVALAGHLTTYAGVNAPMQELTVTNPLNVMEAARPVLQRIEQILSADPKAKIIVNCGEVHTMPVHTLIAAAILASLKKQKIATAYADERPHNDLLTIANEKCGMNIRHDQSESLKCIDYNGENLLTGVIGFYPKLSSPRTRNALYEFCLTEGIRSSFSDAASDKNSFDLRDPLTKAHSDTQCDIEITSNTGMTVRNRVIFTNQLDVIEECNVLVQSIGRLHLVGDKKAGGKNAATLPGIFNARHNDTDHFYQINLLPANSDLEQVTIPVTSCKNYIFIIRGLDNRRFNILDTGEDYYISQVISESGGFMDFQPIPHHQILEYQQQTQAFFDSLPPEFKRAP